MLDTSKVYTSNNHGRFKIIKYNNAKSVEVKFIGTGFYSVVTAGNIRLGKVGDKLFGSVCGVGFVGLGSYAATKNRKQNKAHSVWESMISRCYSPLYHKKYPTYKDCTVCKEWHNFQSFAPWFYANYIDGYHLDKDIKVDGNKVYSPSTCLFVTPTDNIIKSAAKHYKFTSPKGVGFEVFNLSRFCVERMLGHSNMCRVWSGERAAHKGWIKSPE